MTRIFRLLKNKFLGTDKAVDIIGGYSELSGVDTSAFMHPDVNNMINRDIVLLIVKNRFLVDPPLILDFVRDNYDLSVTEYAVLAFELGFRSRLYTEKPKLLLEDALKLNDGTFNDDDISFLQDLLVQLQQNDVEQFNVDHKRYQDGIEAETKKVKTLGYANSEADRQIDEWLAKNK